VAIVTELEIDLERVICALHELDALLLVLLQQM
jgi:hypothetical protein